MHCGHRQKFFAGLYVIVFLGAMWVCTSWQGGIETFASIPIILFAEAVVLGMLYVSIFHGEPGEEAHSSIPLSSIPKVQHAQAPELTRASK